MRLDKYLCDCNLGTRSEVKEYIKKGKVTVNGNLVKKADIQINENLDEISFDGELLCFKKFVYIMLNKPDGVVSATEDNVSKTVLDLINYPAKNLFPVGRLDKDTTGLLLITNDGDLSHQLLSPKKHVDKTYQIKPDHIPNDIEIKCLEEGVDIGDDKPTLPAKVKVTDDKVLLTIHEGRFHQVKRMMEAVNNKVLALKRISFGNLQLDENLPEGQWRELTEDEIKSLIIR